MDGAANDVDEKSSIELILPLCREQSQLLDFFQNSLGLMDDLFSECGHSIRFRRRLKIVVPNSSSSFLIARPNAG